MKEFRKTNDGLFICEECEKLFNNKISIGTHIGMTHGAKYYFYKYLKEESDGFCKICGNKTLLKNSSNLAGYKNCCSKECSKKYNYVRTEEEILKKYNVKNVYSLKEIREKSKHTCLEKYGNENYVNREKGKQTCLEKYGVEYPLQNKEIYKKTEETCLEKYGVENPFQFEEFKIKSKQTCLEKYGVENPMQNSEIFEKSFKTRLKIHQYKDTNLTYQGSYEKHFLDTYHEKIDIEGPIYIPYFFNGKWKTYRTDYFIRSLNLAIEIKNSYLAERDKEEIEIKKNAVLNKGYNYILIVNKNYDELTCLLQEQINELKTKIT